MNLLCSGIFIFMELIIESKKYGRKSVIIDDEDFDLINKYHWCISYVRGAFYCTTAFTIDGKKYQKKMHRVIMGVDDPSIHIDHRSIDGLDNRRCNLRVATIAQNTRDVGPNSKNTTGYKGVYMYKEGHKNAGKFTAVLRFNGKKIFGGYFKTAEDAAIKYNEMALKYHEEFGYQNKIIQ